MANLANINYPSSPDVQFGYDALNRVTNMVDAAGTTKYAYTAGGQLWTEDGPFTSDTVTNTYQNHLRTALSLAQPTGAWTNGFGYDAAKHLTSVTSPAGTFTYTLGATAAASPLIQKLGLPNTSYITNTYDTVARLTGTWLKTSANSTLDSATYGYNAGNQRTTFTNAAGTRINYTYDKIGQVKVADSSVNTEDRGYVYDAAWNLTKLTNNGTATSFTVDGKNQLMTDPFYYDYYDNNGNLQWQLFGSDPWYYTTAQWVYKYVYDDENRLTSITNYDYSQTPYQRTDFTYDGLGRLRKRAEWTYVLVAGELQAQQQSVTEYIYDGMRVIQERDASNVPTVSYTRGTDLSSTMEGAGGIGGLLARSHGYSGGNWSTNNYYHADGNGNITYLENSSQALAASYRYDAYGNTLSSSGTLAAANVYRFSSKEIHVNTGLYYYGYRWYMPSEQRWLNRDPIQEIGGINLYGFYKNNLVNKIDRFGLCGESCDQICSDFNQMKGASFMSPGTVVCRNNKKCACYVPGPNDPAKGECPDFEKTVTDHETRHLADIQCPDPNASKLWQPLGTWKPGVDGTLAECKARAQTIFDLEAAIANSSGKCKTTMGNYLEQIRSWVMANCD